MKIKIGNAVRCESFWSKFRGLMFRHNPKSLLFVFKKPTRIGIHSFFVRQKFIAVWMLHGNVVDIKIIKPWTAFVRPKSKFDRLLEIPFKSESEIKQFLVGGKKSI